MKIPFDILLKFGQLKLNAPSLIMAGGYLRDLHYGMPHKDIDLWVPSQELMMLRDFFKLEEVEDDPSEASDSQGMKLVTNVKQMLGFEVISVQGWERQDGRFLDYVLDSFDFGICKIAFDGSMFTAHKDFWIDVKEKTLTYMKPNERYERKTQRISRMVGKFPDHRLVDKFPDEPF